MNFWSKLVFRMNRGSAMIFGLNFLLPTTVIAMATPALKIFRMTGAIHDFFSGGPCFLIFGNWEKIFRDRGFDIIWPYLLLLSEVIEAGDAICVTNLYEMLVIIEEEQWAGCYCWEEERVGKHLQKIWHYEYLLKILLIISWTKSHDIKRLHEDLGLLELITLCRISVSFSSLFSLAFPS